MNGARIMEVVGIVPEVGRAWRAPLPDWVGLGDREGEVRASGVRLFESGAELLSGHSPHDLIRAHGGGRYSHWHRGLWFSTSDDSDPRSNGRHYQLLVPTSAASLQRFESDALALSETSSALDRHRVLKWIAGAIYPAYTMSDHGRLIDRSAAFFQDINRIQASGEMLDVVHDRRFGLSEFTRIVTSVPGDIAEVGCHRGAGAVGIARTLQSLGVHRTIHLFDSFAGLSRPDAVDGGAWREHDLACDLATTRANLAGFDAFAFWPGWIPERFHEVADRTFALVHIDVDLHRPTLQSLEFFYDRMAQNGLIVLDDYGFETCPGATAAADAFFADKPESLINLAAGGAFVIKGAHS